MSVRKRVSWLLEALTEFRVAVGLVVLGAPVAVAGVLFRHLLGLGYAPPVIIGLSCLITGLAMPGSGVRRH
ncbi:hypothetical protein ACFYP6_33835 [Streptomyces goshikiensis]|uniref:hypothetical protein n=1 Tax=Streptomyces goshikiensis TaxID=1942 RepID=UPI003693D107